MLGSDGSLTACSYSVEGDDVETSFAGDLLLLALGQGDQLAGGYGGVASENNATGTIRLADP